jgi:hypothetical protein
MIAEIITPLMLATVPLKIEVDQAKYSHVEQKQVVAQFTTRPVTFNATQTFDANGRPRDSDND